MARAGITRITGLFVEAPERMFSASVVMPVPLVDVTGGAVGTGVLGGAGVGVGPGVVGGGVVPLATRR